VVVGGQTITHNFLDPGTYQLTLRAVGPVVAATATQSITITPPPPPQITDLEATPTAVTTGSAVQFVPTTTGSVVQWEWDFEDNGNFVVGTSPGEHIFNTTGTHTVWLRVTGPYGQTDLRSVDITAHAPPDPSTPVASPALSTYTTGDTVGFSSTELGGATVTTWDWNLDNGNDPDIDYSDAGPSISHTFATEGVWTVTVTATGPSGASTSISTVVTVEDPVPPLVAGFTFVVGPLLDVEFTDTSTGPPVDSWAWDFGDGVGGDSAQDPSYTYALAGAYTVTLVVTSGAETSAPFSVLVTVP
jgi:PKD repeat protein